MELRQTLDDYQAMRKACSEILNGWQPADLVPVSVDRSRQILNRDELTESLQAFARAQGWVLFTDRRVVLPAEAPPDWKGTVLNAELYLDELSIRVIRRNQDQWLWVQTRLRQAGEAEATHLGAEVVHQSVDPDAGQLCYRQLWCRDGQDRLRVEDAVFQGFKGA